jgi:excisionase family DNA binding protein
MNRLWTIDEVSAYLKIPKETLYQWRCKGYGPRGARMGKYVRYRAEDVEAWVNEQVAA